mgnify:CR=1 FL=1
MDTRILPEPLEFEWDKGNSNKSWQKHKISLQEAEQVFESERFIILDDISHSLFENRKLIIGPSSSGKLLSAIFTIRRHRVRIISVRPSARKERKIYEESFKGSKI